ncbi:hypothetical protein ENBRE01_1406 [Enteropsectra breve]|nr:hypothetical protein ENBRE01_1029 [Enteropsectra breve]KAI5150289.1 hypothetical protein ENBRE01_1406 [Enteropsectra breve]
MVFTDLRPVYKNKAVEKSFDNSLYFFSKFTGDCPICIEYHSDPHILPCGHAFCKECLQQSASFSRNCPVCNAFYWNWKPVQFFFTEEIKGDILLKRVEIKSITEGTWSSFYEYPYSCVYYENSEEDPVVFLEEKPRPVKRTSGLNESQIEYFYQSVDGQLYFLDANDYKRYKHMPEYIYGKIKSCVFQAMNCSLFPYLSHIPHSYFIHIVTLYP